MATAAEVEDGGNPGSNSICANRAVMCLLAVLLTGCAGPAVNTITLHAGGLHDDVAVAVPAASLPVRIPLEIDALMNAARMHNPELQMLRDLVDEARAFAVTLTGIRNPELRVSYDQGSQVTERSWWREEAETQGSTEWVPAASRRHHTEDADVVRLGLRLFPPNPWLMRAEGAAARATLAAAMADLQAAEWRTECAIGRAVSEITGLREELEIARQLEALQADAAKAVEELLRHQQADVLDELEVRQRGIRANEDVTRSEQAIAVALDQLVLLCGVTPDTDDLRGTALQPHISEEEMQALGRDVLESRQDIMASYWRLQAALSALRGGKARRIPWFAHVQGSYAKGVAKEPLDASVGFETISTGGTEPVLAATDENESEEWGIETAIEIPVFTFHAGATRVERAEVDRRGRALKETIRRAGLEWEAAKRRWNAACELTARQQAVAREHRRKAELLARPIAEAHDMGPEAQWKLREMELQARHAAARAGREQVLAFWRLREVSGKRIGRVQDMHPVAAPGGSH